MSFFFRNFAKKIKNEQYCKHAIMDFYMRDTLSADSNQRCNGCAYGSCSNNCQSKQS